MQRRHWPGKHEPSPRLAWPVRIERGEAELGVAKARLVYVEHVLIDVARADVIALEGRHQMLVQLVAVVWVDLRPHPLDLSPLLPQHELDQVLAILRQRRVPF